MHPETLRLRIGVHSQLMSKSPISFKLTLALALTMMLGPFSTDTYLPAFPTMAVDLGVGFSDIALSISCYIFTLSVSQLIGGALSDHFGRRHVLIGGLVIYSVASLLIGISNSLTSLLLWRVVQAFGAGWVIVSIPALVRDRVGGKEVAKLFSMIGLIMVVAPGIAPSVGSAILEFSTWRGIFYFLATYAVLLIFISLFVIFVEAPPRLGPRIPTTILKRYLDVLRERKALRYVLWQATIFSVLMIFVTHASFIYQEHFGQSNRRFSLLFGANIIAMLCFNLTNRALLTYLKSITILRIATIAHFLGIILLVAATVLDWNVYGFALSMMLTVGSLGAISPNIQANFLNFFPDSGGSAAALIGAAQFSIAGLFSALSTQFPESLQAIIFMMAAIALIPLATMLSGLRESGI